MEGKQKMVIGKYRCRASYTIVGLTNQAKEDFNKLLAKEEGNGKYFEKTIDK